MTDTLITFSLFWGIWLLVPMLIDGSTAVAYLIGAWKVKRQQMRKRRQIKLEHYPLVTIIIPVHNGAPYLKKCIASLRGQSYPHDKLEVFVVDNLSNDQTFNVFKEEQAQPFEGSLQWVSVPQRGKSYALNAGIHMSRGEYVSNIDCDVVLHPDAILNMVKAFVADHDLGAATGSVEVMERKVEGSDPWRHLLAECEFQEYYSGFRIGRQYQTATNSLFTLAGAFSVFRRDVLLRTFLYDKQTVSEDTKMTFEIHKRFAELNKACIAEAIAYVEPTPSLSALYAQRVRWQRGQLEVASLYTEFVRSPLRIKGLSSPKSLIVDHTLAFPRVVWAFLLPMLYFVGYSLTLVVTATLAMYLCYMAIEVLYEITCYLLADNGPKQRVARNWWLFAVMPAFRYTVFWFRFGGFLSVLMEPAEWRVKDPVTEVRMGLSRLRGGVVSTVTSVWHLGH